MELGRVLGTRRGLEEILEGLGEILGACLTGLGKVLTYAAFAWIWDLWRLQGRYGIQMGTIVSRD